MKRIIKTTLILLSLFLCSCAGQRGVNLGLTPEDSTQTYSFADSCQHLIVKTSIQLPSGNDEISKQIRDSLIADYEFNMSHFGFDPENDGAIKPYRGDRNNVQDIVDYYGKACYDYLLDMAKNDYNDRVSFLEEDSTILPEDKERIRNEIPMWEYDFTLSKLSDEDLFVVYNSQSYIYMGGAHGGVAGTGALTFDKSNGEKIDRFLKKEAVKDLQPAIRKGLLKYYMEAYDTLTDEQLSERIQIEGTTIPLPSRATFPNKTGDSLVFTYGQYEIACYADGMPSFKVAVKDILPCLTEKGKSLLTGPSLHK